MSAAGGTVIPLGPWRRPHSRGVGGGAWTCEGWNEWSSDFQESLTFTLLRVRKWYPLTLFIYFAFGKRSNHLHLLQEHSMRPLSENGLKDAYIDIQCLQHVWQPLSWNGIVQCTPCSTIHDSEAQRREMVTGDHYSPIGWRVEELPCFYPEGGGEARL